MFVSVVICTYDRAQLLDQTLNGMRSLRIPEGVEWELLVVCNNCTRETDEVIGKYSPHLPVCRLFETKQGLSHARNCALEAARGELLAWTDDDVLVDHDWLVEHVKAAAEHPEAAFFGGAVEPWFASDPPKWLERNWKIFSGAYAVRDNGTRQRPILTEDDLDIVGANMVMRRDAVGDLRFSPELGLFPGQLLGGDEYQFLLSLLAKGSTGLWVGSAKVRHHIPTDRCTQEYLWEYYLGQGKSSIRMGLSKYSATGTSGQARLKRKYVKTLVRSWLYSISKGEAWAEAFRAAAKARGMMDELQSHEA